MTIILELIEVIAPKAVGGQLSPADAILQNITKISVLALSWRDTL